MDEPTSNTSAMGIHESIPVIIFFLVLFGIFYLHFSTRHRERMSMIEKGMPIHQERPLDHPLRSLKNGLLFIGIGIGMVVGYLFQQAIATEGEHGPLPYAVGMCICGGAALVLFYVFFGRKQQG
jgi:uncharacterized membrane protein YidH (DUF202 family)